MPKQGGRKKNAAAKKAAEQKKKQKNEKHAKVKVSEKQSNRNPKKKKKQQSRRKEKARTEARARAKAQREEASLQRARLKLILSSKFQNPDSSVPPSELETQICQYLIDLEASSHDLRPHLRDLGIVNARRQEINPTKKSIVIFVPFAQHVRWKKIQDRVQRELEKKFSGEDVIFLAQRKIVKLNQIKNNYPRPRTQTITAVHEGLLNDLVYPTNIVGKRWRFRVGGKRILKVYLDPKDSKDIEQRIRTYEVVYRRLTKKVVQFMFPRYVI